MRKKKVYATLAMQTAFLQLIGVTPAWAQARPGSHPAPSTNVSNITLGSGQTRVLDFGQSSILKIANSLNILPGATIYAVSSNPNIHTLTLQASNIFNSGLLTTVLPTGGLPGYSNLVSGLSLNLVAQHKFVNQGLITSAGNLSVFAGDQLTNSSANGTAAVIQATNNLNLFSPSITNSGTMSANTGNVNINNAAVFNTTLAGLMNNSTLSSLIGSDFHLLGTGGTVSALAGDINIGSIGSSISGLNTINILGGNYLSQNLNIDAGQGKIIGNLGQVSGFVNLSGCSANFGAATDVLKLGELNITGDPTYFNTAGSLVLNVPSGISTEGADLALLASGDIIVNNTIYTAAVNSNSNAGNLTVIAGADLITSNGSSSGTGDMNTVVTVNGPSSTGGAIDLSGSKYISTGAIHSPGDGGNQLYVAYGGTGTGSGLDAGTINLNVSLGIRSVGVDSKSGNITIISGATSMPAGQNAIKLPGISANNGIWTGGFLGGSLTLAQATPQGQITIKNGSILTGTIVPGSLQKVDIGAASSPMYLGNVEAPVSFLTAGDVYAFDNNLFSIGPSQFGSIFQINNAGPIYVRGDIVGISTNSSISLTSTSYQYPYAIAPYAPIGVLRVGSSHLVASSVQTSIVGPANKNWNLTFVDKPITEFFNGPQFFPNLDLTDPQTVREVVQNQNLNAQYVGGNLLVTDGVASGGNVIIQSSNNLSSLNSVNVPSGVLVSMVDFSPTSPININLNESSHYPSAQINGTQQFVSSSVVSNPVINISTTLSAPALHVGGVISSDGSLQINSSAKVAVEGQVTAAGAATIRSDNVDIAAGGTVKGGVVTIQGVTSGGSLASGTGLMLNNSGVIESTAGSISVMSAPGQDLSVDGTGGQFVSPANQSVNLLATDNPLGRHPNTVLDGTLSFSLGDNIGSGGSVNIIADGGPSTSVTMNAQGTYDFPNDFTVVDVTTGQFFGNPSQLTVHTAAHPNPKSKLNFYLPAFGTIANNAGPVDLSQVESLNFAGKNIAILSSGDIINSSGAALTVNAKGGDGSGGNITLLAGFDFSPASGNSTAPLPGTYNLIGPSVSGGSIRLSTVNFDSSGNAGGGNLLAVASRGKTSDGSISLGNIFTQAGAGRGGDVTLEGYVITTGDIKTTASTLSKSGIVSINSSQSIKLSNSSGMKVVDGIVQGGYFQVGLDSGSVSCSSIDAGQSYVGIAGGSISVLGPFKSSNMHLSASSGGILISDARISNSIYAYANGLVDITNVGDILFNGVSQNSLILHNTGNVTLKELTAAIHDFTVVTVPSPVGNGRILVDCNLGAVNISLTSSSSGTGIGGIQLSPGKKLLAASIYLKDNGTSTTLGANGIGNSAVPISSSSHSLVAISLNGDTWLSNEGYVDLTAVGNNVTVTNNGHVSLVNYNGFLWYSSARDTFRLTAAGPIWINSNVDGIQIYLSSSRSQGDYGGIESSGLGGSDNSGTHNGGFPGIVGGPNTSLISLVDTSNYADGTHVVGTIGTATQPISTFVSGITTAKTSFGDIYLSNKAQTPCTNNSVEVSTTGDVNYQTTGQVTFSVTPGIVPKNVSLSAVGDITVSGDLAAANGLFIFGGSIRAEGTLKAPDLTLRGAKVYPMSAIASKVSLSGDISNLSIIGMGGILDMDVLVGGDVTIRTVGQVTLHSQYAQGLYSLTNSGGSILIAGPTKAGVVSLVCNDCGIQALGSGSLSATKSISMTVNSTGSDGSNLDIGSASLPIYTSTPSLAVTNSGKNIPINVWINNTCSSCTSVVSIANGVSSGYVGGSVNLQNTGGLILQNTSGTNLSVSSTEAIAVAANNVVESSGKLELHADTFTISAGALLKGATVSLTGQTIDGNFASKNNMTLNNSGTIQSTANDVLVNTALGQDLTITGDGSGRFIAASSLNIIANNNPAGRAPNIALASGDQSFIVGMGTAPGGSVIISASNKSSITIEPGMIYDFPNEYSHVVLSADAFFGNPSQFQVHTAAHPNPNSTFDIYLPVSGSGTIANSSGVVDLSQLSSLNFGGNNIAILASSDIINSSNSPLSINLGGGPGNGGSLTLIAGFDFSPDTNKLVAMGNQTYTLNSAAPQGGSIQLSTVSIDTSGATGGGNVLAVANSGSISDGSISLGTVASNGGSGRAGSVTIIGNGINVGAIDTTSNSSALSGDVSLCSTSAVALSNPGGMQIVNGLLSGGTFVPGTRSGAITISSVASGKASVTILAGSYSQQFGTSIDCGNLELSVASGPVSLNINASSLQISANGDTAISSKNALNLTSASINGSLSLIDPQAITVSGALSVASGTINTPSLTILGLINSSSGPLHILSPEGAQLQLAGNGSITAPGQRLTFDSSAQKIIFSGTLTLSAANTTVNAFSLVQVDSIVNVSGDLLVNTFNLVNPSGFHVSAGTTTFNLVPTGEASLGTLVNPNGDINLSSNTIVNSGGKNLLILASGNVFASGISKIDLSSRTSSGGNLTILAGMKFSPSTASGAVFDTSTMFNIEGPSSSGGSIALANISIDTSSSAASGITKGGNVLLVSNAVPGVSSGVILTGAISTKSTASSAGSVTIIAPGGISVNGAIMTSGKTSSGAVVLAATSPAHGAVLISNGAISPVNFSPSAPSDGSAAAVIVNGGISTNTSGTGSGGAVAVISESQIKITGSVVTNGQTTSGAISLYSLNGSASIQGSLNASGKGGTRTLTPGAGGAVSVKVPEFATINGSILTYGGSSSVAGQNGGAGGAIVLQTASRDFQGTSYNTGIIKITGGMNSAGGRSASKAGSGGAGGNITVQAGSLQVSGQVLSGSTSASIIASGGTGKLGAGTNGDISIDTYAIQSVPSNFDLLSIAATEYVLPGGLFNVGNAAANGVAGKIITGNSVLSSTNGAAIGTGTSTFGQAGQGTIKVTPHGGSADVLVDGKLIHFQTSNGAVRSKVTPAEAVALYQVSHGQLDSLGLNKVGQAISINPQDNTKVSLISIPSNDLPTFTKFVLQSKDISSGIKLEITGKSPVLNLASVNSAIVGGQISFTNSSSPALIDTGTHSFTLRENAVLTTGGLLVLSSPNITLMGGINASELVLMPLSGTSMVLKTLATSSLNVQNVVLPSMSGVHSYTFTDTLNYFSSPVIFESLHLGTAYGGSTKLNAPSFSETLTLNFATIGVRIGGDATFKQLSVNGSSFNYKNQKYLTAIEFTTGNIEAISGISISSDVISTLAGSNLSVSAGALKLSAKINLDLGGNLNAGVLKGNYGTVKLQQADVISAGTIQVSGNSVEFRSGMDITSNAGNLSVIARKGSLNLGSSNTFTANGGSLYMLATGNILGDSDNVFVSTSLGTVSKSTGGGIELGAGSTTSTLASAETKRSGTANYRFATLFTLNNSNNTSGAVLSSDSYVNLSSSGTKPAVLNLTGGAIDFHAKNATLRLDGATFTVTGFKPISYSLVEQVRLEKEITTNNKGNRQILGHIFVPGLNGAQAISANDLDSTCEGSVSSVDSAARIQLHSGEIFFAPKFNTEIHTDLVEIKARKGGVVAVSSDSSGVRVVNCGGANTVEVIVGSQFVKLTAGEEIFVSNANLTLQDCLKADGVGRRNANRMAFKNGLHGIICDASIVSMMTSLTYLNTLRHPTTSVEKRIAAKLLKTAYALSLVTGHRGSYQSRAAIKPFTKPARLGPVANMI